MNHPAVELNFRLDTKSGVNNLTAFNQREQLALELLGQHGQVSRRLRGFWPGHVRILILSVRVDAIPADALMDLAQVLLQDCISVYYPNRGEGAMVGPKASAWGAFDLDKFYRFDPDLNTVIREPKPFVKPVPEPVDEETSKRQLATMCIRINQVFPPNVWDALAPQQRIMTDNAINRVINNDGMEALTVARLEGIYELVTEHLWSPALTAAAKSLPEKP